jgi:hypothetical protein
VPIVVVVVVVIAAIVLECAVLLRTDYQELVGGDEH